MNRFALAACFAAYGLSGSVLAEPATKAGAQELRDTLHRYLGGSTWAIQVVAVDDHYSVILDPQAIVESLSVEGLRASGSTITLALTDNGNGTWAYVLEQPITLIFTLPFQQPIEVWFIAQGLHMTGVFDENLGLSPNFELVATEVEFRHTTSHPDPRVVDLAVDRWIETLSIEGTVETTADGVTQTISAKAENTHFSVTVPRPDMEPLRLKGKIVHAASVISVSGYRVRELLDLWAWMLEHLDIQSGHSDIAELKTRIEKALPIFTELRASSTNEGIELRTDAGGAVMDSLALEFGISGIVQDGFFQEGLSVSGLIVSDPLVPEYARSLVPTDISMDLTLKDFDPSGAAYVLLKMLDQPFGSPPPAGLDEALLASLLPNGAVTVTLDAGAVTGRDYKLTYEGALTAGPAQPDPTFTARLALTGMEAIRTAMQSAPPELELGTAAMGLGAMGGLAKPGTAGELVWEISLDEAGTVLVNGLDVEKMFGNQ